MKRTKKDYKIEAVIHAIMVLEEVSVVQEIGVTALGQRLGLCKNKVFRLLATLEAKGFIEQSKATEDYRLGIRSLQLGHAYSRQSSLLQQARPILEELVVSCGEMAYVGILSGYDAVCLDAVEAEQSVRVANCSGLRSPAYASAVGKALISVHAAEEWDKWLPAVFEAFTRYSPTTHKAVLKSLNLIKTQGFAVDAEEFEYDVRSVAAPVYDHTHEAIGALAISAPAYRLQDERICSAIVPQLLKAAKRLSLRLGYETELRAVG